MDVDIVSSPQPENEEERLQELYAYAVLDTKCEEAFDSLTWLASEICQVPISLVSLLDSERQWFKSRVGLDVEETPREFAFCRYTILQSDILEVSDVTSDDRFKDNPLVTGDPNIRFYAGTQLTTPNGYNLGTLCVIDRKPRELNDFQRNALKTLGSQVMNILELRLCSKELEESNRELERSNGELSNFSRIASHELTAPIRAIRHLSTWITEDAGEVIPEESKKNLRLLTKSAERMYSLITELGEYSRVGEGRDQSDLIEVAEMVESLVYFFGVGDRFEVEVSADTSSLMLPRVPVEKVFRNLLQNAIVHHDQEKGKILIESRELENGLIEFRMTDDGPGIPLEFQDDVFEMFRKLKPKDEVEGSGIGLSLVKKTVEMWNGSISVESDGRGACFIFTLPQSLPT